MSLVYAGVQGLSNESRSIERIAVFCFVTYGFVAVLWFFHFFMPSNNGKLWMVLLCLSWASASVGMHVLNKALVTALEAPALITLAQMAVTCVVTAVMSFQALLKSDGKQLLIWMIVPLFFAGMLCSSAYSYAYISLSVLTIVRNLSPLFSLPIETAVMPQGKQPQVSILSVVAILIMLAGALVYGEGVAGISFIGIALAVANMLIAVADRVIQRRLLTEECKGLTSGVCTLVTNFAGMLPTVMLAAGTHQFADALKPEGIERWSHTSTICLLILSGLIGLAIGYFGFECQRAISATSFFVLQNASKVIVVSAGVGFFGDPLTFSTMAGMVLSLSGSLMYGYVQMAPKVHQSELAPLIREKASPKASP